MAKIKLQGHASGTGILTVTAPNTSTDRTITLPDSTGTLIADDGSGKVGIGTSSPARLLSLYGDTGIALQNSTTGTGTGNGTHIWVNSEGSGELLIQNRENSDIEFLANDTERMRILAGGGLTFNGDTAAANALEDYEEGTFTPLLKFSGATTGIVQNSSYTTGWYTKVGNLVNFGFILILSSKGSASGSAQITGLPFALNDSTYQQTTLSLSMENVSFADQNWAYMPRNNTVITLRESTNAGSGSNIADTNVANNSQFMCQGTYISG